MRDQVGQMVELNKEINQALNEKEDQISALTKKLEEKEALDKESFSLPQLLKDTKESLIKLTEENQKLQENVIYIK